MIEPMSLACPALARIHFPDMFCLPVTGSVLGTENKTGSMLEGVTVI